MDNYIKKYEPFFGNWYIKNLIGEGSFGHVYEIERHELGQSYYAALKTISIPQNNSEIKSLYADGMTENDITKYFQNVVQDIINEYVLMSKLKGNSNIVSYEDHILIKHEDNIGYDILIRMELLTPLFDYMQKKDISKRDIIKMGIDLCKALELCQHYNIIHRDVKPENIFVSPTGDFKLGDFGIARTIEKTTNGLSKKGTYSYMAPEVYRGEAYGSNVDIYSLGIVLYRLLNNNRLPFLPNYPDPITYQSKEAALYNRISGKPIPIPVNADGRLAEIVLKACAFNPKDRFDSALEMRMALESIMYEEEEKGLVYPNGDNVPLPTSQQSTPIVIDLDKTEAEDEATAKEEVISIEDATANEENEGTVLLDIEETVILNEFEEEPTVDEHIIEESKEVEETIILDEFEEESTIDDIISDDLPAEDIDTEEPIVIEEPVENYYIEEPFENPVEENVVQPLTVEQVIKAETKKKKKDKKKDKKKKKKKKDKNNSQNRKTSKARIPIAAIFCVAILIFAFFSMNSVKGISLYHESDEPLVDIYVHCGESIELTHSVNPDRLSGKEIKCTTDDTDIAIAEPGEAMSNTNIITGVKVGRTKLTVKLNHFTKRYTIIVEPKVTEITNVSDITVYEGESYQLAPKLLPEEYSDETITFKSKNKDIAKVNSDGLINAVNVGTTKIVIKAGGAVKKITIDVTERPVVVNTPKTKTKSKSKPHKTSKKKEPTFSF